MEISEVLSEIIINCGSVSSITHVLTRVFIKIYSSGSVACMLERHFSPEPSLHF